MQTEAFIERDDIAFWNSDVGAQIVVALVAVGHDDVETVDCSSLEYGD